jgi:hypothetical protein
MTELVQKGSGIIQSGHIRAHVGVPDPDEIGNHSRARRCCRRQLQIPAALEQPQEQVIEIAEQPAAFHT